MLFNKLKRLKENIKKIKANKKFNYKKILSNFDKQIRTNYLNSKEPEFEDVLEYISTTVFNTKAILTTDLVGYNELLDFKDCDDIKYDFFNDGVLAAQSDNLEDVLCDSHFIADLFYEDALGVNPDDINCADASIITKYCSLVNTRPRVRKIEYIVFHYTAGGSSKPGVAVNTALWFAKGERSASADFIVDDRDLVQYNPDPAKNFCFSVGDSGISNSKHGRKFKGKCNNRNSISIEMCSTLKSGSAQSANHKGWMFTDAVIKNSIKLGAILMKKYNIDIDHCIRHYDVTGKLCPGIIGWNMEDGSGYEGKWISFKNVLNSKYKALKNG